MFSFLFKDSSLDSHKKKEVVTGESEMKPRIGVLNQDQGISLDIPSNEESDSDKELESLGKKIEEDKKRYQLMLKKKEAKKHQSGELITFSVKRDTTILSKTLEKLLTFV